MDKENNVIKDMSNCLGQTVVDTVHAINKAMSDPIKGIDYLKRVGVTFTDTQIKNIKDMQNKGNIETAQTIILDELNREFGTNED